MSSLQSPSGSVVVTWSSSKYQNNPGFHCHGLFLPCLLHLHHHFTITRPRRASMKCFISATRRSLFVLGQSECIPDQIVAVLQRFLHRLLILGIVDGECRLCTFFFVVSCVHMVGGANALSHRVLRSWTTRREPQRRQATLEQGRECW
jgi:hypothetical protein